MCWQGVNKEERIKWGLLLRFSQALLIKSS